MSVDGGWVTVDGRDGPWHRGEGRSYFGLGGVPFAVATGSELVVGRGDGGGQTLVARDRATGRELWRRSVAGTRSTRVTIYPGRVLVTARVQTLNPFVGHDEREKGYTVTRLDPKTGRPTAELFTKRLPGTSMALDDGRLVVQTGDDLTIAGDPDG